MAAKYFTKPKRGLVYGAGGFLRQGPGGTRGQAAVIVPTKKSTPKRKSSAEEIRLLKIQISKLNKRVKELERKIIKRDLDEITEVPGDNLHSIGA
jgi:hypothetical protein